MLVSDSVPAPINGVSQQPSTLRLPSQVSEQINAYSSEVDGLRKRPPLVHTGKLSSTPFDAAYLHAINRDATEKYTVVMTDGDLRVFDASGAEKTVAFPNGKGYLACGDKPPVDVFRAVSIADYTFVTNRCTKAAMAPDRSPQAPHEALIVVRQGVYDKSYSVALMRNGATEGAYWVNNTRPPPTNPDFVSCTRLTPDGSDPVDVHFIATDSIAYYLTELLFGYNSAVGAGYTITLYGSVIHISHPSPFEINILDGQSGNGMAVVRSSTQRFATLPNVAPEGFHLEIVGDVESSFDSYYVAFEKLAGGDGTGVWRETIAADTPYRINRATVPHVLVREADGTFTFRQAQYEDRKVGDIESVPDPSFIGRNITDIVLFRSRLGFLADENVILSEPSNLFNFFATTATEVLDDAPVDFAITANAVSLLQSAVIFGGRLLLFSDQQQIEFRAAETLTPRSIAAPSVAQFENDPKVRPVATGTGAFFIQNAGKFSRLRELFVTDDGITLDAQDVTQTAPSYLPAGIFRTAASTTLNLIVALSTLYPNRLYFYKYTYEGRTKVQSALFHWQLPAGHRVIEAQFLGTDLKVIYTTADGTFSGYFPLAADSADPEGVYLTHLDRRVDETKCTAVLQPGENPRTSITVPYVLSGAPVLVTREGDETPGELAQVVSATGTQLLVEGDFTDRQFFVGLPYEMRVRLSPLLLRKQDSQSSTAVLSGRLQLRYVTVKYAGTGMFTMRVSPRGRPVYDVASTGRMVGETVLNEVAVLPDGLFRFPVQCRNTDVELDLIDSTHLPARFQSLEWEGFYTTRSRSLR